jgi:hypothetical protein
VREIFGDEFCTYQPPDPAVTGADTGRVWRISTVTSSNAF